MPRPTWSISNNAILWAEPQMIRGHMRFRPQVDLPGVIRPWHWTLQTGCWGHKMQHFHDETDIQHQGRPLQTDLHKQQHKSHTGQYLCAAVSVRCVPQLCKQTQLGDAESCPRQASKERMMLELLSFHQQAGMMFTGTQLGSPTCRADTGWGPPLVIMR